MSKVDFTAFRGLARWKVLSEFNRQLSGSKSSPLPGDFLPKPYDERFREILPEGFSLHLSKNLYSGDIWIKLRTGVRFKLDELVIHRIERDTPNLVHGYSVVGPRFNHKAFGYFAPTPIDDLLGGAYIDKRTKVRILSKTERKLKC